MPWSNRFPLPTPRGILALPVASQPRRTSKLLLDGRLECRDEESLARWRYRSPGSGFELRAPGSQFKAAGAYVETAKTGHAAVATTRPHRGGSEYT
ncbi:hypothetical protein MRX96_025648 [Rhipicephalus microplus]